METIVNFASDIAIDFWATLAEMSPFLLFGFFVAGLISIWLSPSFVETHLGGKGPWPLIKASLFGVPLPLCSCGVIPVAMSLRKHGASKGATIAFLLSTPQTGIDSFFVTYSLLGPVFAIFRPVITFITGLIGGFGIQLLHEKEETENSPPPPACTDVDCACRKKQRRFSQAMKYGFVTLPKDIAKAMLFGLLIAAFISAIVPADFFAEKLGTGIFAMIIMMFLGIPVYVCATASVPIAAVLIAKGLTPGAALVFLMTGPATNAAGLVTIYKILGRKTAIIYLITVALCSLAAGILLDALALTIEIDIIRQPSWMLPQYIKYLSAFVLLAVLGYAIYKKSKDTTHQ